MADIEIDITSSQQEQPDIDVHPVYGPKGANGANGRSATIEVGTVRTGAAGTSAIITNSGDSSNAVFNFTIPKGDTGEQGETGVSVTGVTLLSTVGLDKTYRMTFSDNTYFDYVVSNGASGSTRWGGISGTLSNQTDLQNALNSKQDTISDIATIRTGASAGATALQSGDNITELNNNAGYITGINSSDVTTALGYTPYNSTNPNGYTSNVGTITGITMNGASKGTSGVVDLGTVITAHQDISGKEDKLKTVNVLNTSGTVALTDNSINSITPSGNITFTLPTITDNTVFHEIMVQINLSTVYTIDVGTTNYFNKTAPDLSSAGTYNLYYEYDKATQQWYCGALSKGTVS